MWVGSEGKPSHGRLTSATCCMDQRLGAGQSWVEVSGGSLSHRLPAVGWRGSLMACAPPGIAAR